MATSFLDDHIDVAGLDGAQLTITVRTADGDHFEAQYRLDPDSVLAATLSREIEERRSLLQTTPVRYPTGRQTFVLTAADVWPV